MHLLTYQLQIFLIINNKQVKMGTEQIISIPLQFFGFSVLVNFANDP